ncbi:MAG: TIGR02281 family clan AA aspartic protease [Betaproteobacteria bacterium]|nr:TIGR02281 family clan AA aspartic protease [Betaproteobacteria bacterium]
MVIDGGRPRTVAVGANTPEGVRLVAVDAAGAIVEMEGRRRRLALGVPVVSGEEGGAPGDSVALPPDSRGHFVTTGRVNGVAMQFLVDTGATFVSLGAADAHRAGIDYRRGEPAATMTANGRAQVWRVRLASVRVGDVTLNDVEAAVHSGDLPVALLGMSFLNRMEMRHEGRALVLRKRY